MGRTGILSNFTIRGLMNEWVDPLSIKIVIGNFLAYLTILMVDIIPYAELNPIRAFNDTSVCSFVSSSKVSGTSKKSSGC